MFLRICPAALRSDDICHSDFVIHIRDGFPRQKRSFVVGQYMAEVLIISAEGQSLLDLLPETYHRLVIRRVSFMAYIFHEIRAHVVKLSFAGLINIKISLSILTSLRQDRVHFEWQLYCFLMRWEVKFRNLSNQTKANLVMMKTYQHRLPKSVGSMINCGYLIIPNNLIYKCSLNIFLI